jgi:hypothetical protein
LPPLKEIQDLSDIPENMSEEEAAEFWSTHSLGEKLLEQMERAEDDPDVPPVRPRKSISTSIRLDADITRRLKALSKRKGKGCQVSEAPHELHLGLAVPLTLSAVPR